MPTVIMNKSIVMKSLYLLLISCSTVLSVFAQNTSTLTIQVNGKNNQVMVDGTSYELNTVAGTSRFEPIMITDLLPGTHKIQIERTNPNKTKTRSSKTIKIRSGYDMTVTVNGNGTIATKETSNKSTAQTVEENIPGMTEQKFNSLVSNVKKQWKTSAKMTMITNAFKDTKNMFTTDQAGQLIQLVSGETNRLQLAKASYRSISDPNTFSDVEELLTTDKSKDELRAYVVAYKNNSTGDYTAKGAMSETKFNTLLKNVKDQWKASVKTTTVNNAFKDRNNYFTTDQAGQLIELITSESDRLMLAKASYRGIVDTARFTDLNELLNSTESRNELAQYVYTYNGGKGSINNNNNSGTAVRKPMEDSDFNNLYRTIQGQWLPFSKMSSLTTAFANNTNYFSTSQAKQLILLVTDEDNRLELAKSSYRNITDPSNFSQLYDILPTQAKKDELANYVKNFRPI